MAEYIEKIDELTRQYNDAINALEDSYNMESSQVSGLQILTSSKLKHQYSNKYEELAKEYAEAGYQAVAEERLAAYQAGNSTKLLNQTAEEVDLSK